MYIPKNNFSFNSCFQPIENNQTSYRLFNPKQQVATEDKTQPEQIPYDLMQIMTNSLLEANKIMENINTGLPEDQRVEIGEIYEAIKNCYLSPKLPVHISKLKSQRKHSVVIFKNGEEFHILIKPNLKNVKYPVNTANKHENFAYGAYKKIKTSGVWICLDKHGKYVQNKRVVIISESCQNNKNDALCSELHNTLIKEGFSLIKYHNDKNKPRVIYIKKYLGDDICTLLKSKKLTPETRRYIIKELFSNFKTNMGDIKGENVLWDGKNATFIDHSDLIFTYTSKSDEKRQFISIENANKILIVEDLRGLYDDYANALQIKQQQIFSLCVLFYQIYGNTTAIIEGAGFDHEKPPELANLKTNNLFCVALSRAYNETLTWNCLQAVVSKL